MTKLKEVYKCNVCGNIVEVLHTGAGELVCCDQPMELKVAKTEEGEGYEKHLPVITRTEEGVKVTIGSNLHPMEEGHYIEWIEVIGENFHCRKFLQPGDNPEVEFKTDQEKITAREYCNIHGLWETKN
jgi:superoxide reductase